MSKREFQGEFRFAEEPFLINIKSNIEKADDQGNFFFSKLVKCKASMSKRIQSLLTRL